MVSIMRCEYTIEFIEIKNNLLSNNPKHGWENANEQGLEFLEMLKYRADMRGKNVWKYTLEILKMNYVTLPEEYMKWRKSKEAVVQIT